jgi:hypothetical protein
MLSDKYLPEEQQQSRFGWNQKLSPISQHAIDNQFPSNFGVVDRHGRASCVQQRLQLLLRCEKSRVDRCQFDVLVVTVEAEIIVERSHETIVTVFSCDVSCDSI